MRLGPKREGKPAVAARDLTQHGHFRRACDAGAAVVPIPDTIEDAIELAELILVMRDGEEVARYDMSTGIALSVEDVFDTLDRMA